MAAESGSFALVSLLLKADKGGMTPPLVERRDEEGCSPLMLACGAGDAPSVGLLLRASARVDEQSNDSFTPLMRAALYGHADAVRVLLESPQLAPAGGAVVQSLVDFAKPDGFTALQLAALQGQTAVVRLLLGARADVNLANLEGVTPLMHACKYGHSDAARALLQLSLIHI